MHLRGTSWATACALALFLAPATASAQAAPPDKARAVELFKKSEDAYRAGDFDKAIKLLDEAYALDPQPVLVYNRARAAEGIGDFDGAIAGYEKFLAEEPNTRDRGAIEQRLATLKRQRDERAALVKERDARRDAPPPPPPPPPPREEPAPPPPTPEKPAQRSVYPYVVAGAGGVGLVMGTIFGVMALGKKDDAVNERTQQKSMDLKDSADGLATASTVSFVIGSVLVVAGVTWWVLDSKKTSAGRVGPYVTASGVGVTLP